MSAETPEEITIERPGDINLIRFRLREHLRISNAATTSLPTESLRALLKSDEDSNRRLCDD